MISKNLFSEMSFYPVGILIVRVPFLILLISKGICMDNFNDYVDSNGRYTLHPVSESKELGRVYESQNQHLWTGEAHIFRYLNNEIGWNTYHASHRKTADEYNNFIDIMKKTRMFKGLYTRHVSPFKYVESKHFDSMSFDEHNGIAFSAAVFKRYDELDDIIEYGDKNSWCVYEKQPHYSPMRDLWRNPSKIKPFLINLYDVIKASVSTKFRGSKAVDQIIFKNEVTTGLSRCRLPKDVAYLKLLSPSYKPSLIGLLHLIVTSFHTINKDKPSGRIMLYFKLKSFEIIGYNPWWVKKLRKRFNSKINIRAEFKRFYPVNHPFHKYLDLLGEN